jgi:hypothetical protein
LKHEEQEKLLIKNICRKRMQKEITLIVTIVQIIVKIGYNIHIEGGNRFTLFPTYMEILNDCA